MKLILVMGPREGVTPAIQGQTSVHLEDRGEGNLEARALFGVSLGKVRRGRVDGLRLASLNNSGGLWGGLCWLGPWSQSDLGQGKFSFLFLNIFFYLFGYIES